MGTSKFQKTSVQLTPEMLRDLDGTWPGLTRSEAIRLSVERMRYCSSLDAEDISGTAFTYAPILDPALEDFGYEDFRAVARALPAIVAGFVGENRNHTWRAEPQDRELNPNELIEELEKMDAFGRIGILDCVVAQRKAPPAPRAEQEKADQD